MSWAGLIATLKTSSRRIDINVCIMEHAQKSLDYMLIVCAFMRRIVKKLDYEKLYPTYALCSAFLDDVVDGDGAIHTSTTAAAAAIINNSLMEHHDYSCSGCTCSINHNNNNNNSYSHSHSHHNNNHNNMNYCPMHTLSSTDTFSKHIHYASLSENEGFTTMNGDNLKYKMMTTTSSTTSMIPIEKNKPSYLIKNTWLRYLDSYDRYFSGFIHKMELSNIDYIILIPGTIFGVWGVPLMILWYRYYFDSWLYFWNAIIITSINEILKVHFSRPRPHPKNLGIKKIDLRSVHNTGAMPSGDAAQAAAIAILLLFHGYSKWWLIPLPIIGGFGRTYFGSHWIGDCVVGAIYGGLACYFISFCFYPVFFK